MIRIQRVALSELKQNILDKAFSERLKPMLPRVVTSKNDRSIVTYNNEIWNMNVNK